MCNEFKVSREVLIFAFRYAIGRQSYASTIVMDNIKNNINEIPVEDIKLYIREIKSTEFYEEYDKKCWLHFLKYLEGVLEDRCEIEK